MPDVRLTRAALGDVDDLWDALAQRDAQNASQAVRGLRERFEALAAFPEMGRHRPDLGSGVRAFSFGNYVAFYRPGSDGVVVLRVLHRRRDVRPDLFDDV